MRPFILALITLLTCTASAQAGQAPPTQPQQPAQAGDIRPATVSATGDTGLWFVPTAKVLPHKKWSMSLYRTNADFGQGYSDVSNWPVSFAVGLGGRTEIFGSWTALTRIDRDIRPLFGAGTPAGSSGGIVNEYPLVPQNWVGDARGDLRLGAKLSLVSQTSETPVAFALRGSVKLPTGDDVTGASTGKVDFTGDLVMSFDRRVVEYSVFAGMITRGDPEGFDISDAIRWGFGVGFLPRSQFRITTEVHGEFYRNNEITAPGGFAAEDGSIAPLVTTLKNPVYAAVGLTWQSTRGIFVGAGLNWSSAVKDRLTSDSGFGDKVGIQLRMGYHPGVRQYVAPVPPPPVEVAPPPPVVAPRVTNRPPVVRAACDPCTVEVGKVSTVTGTATDPDGDALTYRWTTRSGSLANPTALQTTWTAPMTVGPVPVTITATDPGGLSASADVTIQVVQAAVKAYVFEDVHFEFDKNVLRPDALVVLDEAIAALKATPDLRLQIEGHTCNIGSSEYNMALAERRARAVRDYLAARGVDPSRLNVVTYGEERPKHDNDREETRRLNRRAALVVTVVR